MNIPEKLQTTLEGSQVLHGAVLQTLGDFEPWFSDNKLFFFPEYTDHSDDHVAQVLASSASLIGEASWKVLTAEDSAVLIIGVILHDCAMHLSTDGFASLIQQQTDERPSGYFYSQMKDLPWPTSLWREFLREAKLFNARRLKELFGDAVKVREPSPDPVEWSDRDRLLIGEFLRRHHARLAHEIALHGVPGPTGKRLSLIGFNAELTDLAGFVARSHNMDLRRAVDYLARRGGGHRVWRGVHVPFLMAVLRVADYLRIEASRAPEQVLRVRSLRSPFSRREWGAHHAIRDVRQFGDDPEAIYIDAAPGDVRLYLRLRDLVDGLQRELDQVWAVLGEVYGRVTPDLGIRLRRVESNLDNKADFAATVPYVPERIMFRADGELLKLLVGPLYGHDPSYGIRELLQNAVDACLERDDYHERLGTSVEGKFIEREPDVLFRLEVDGSGEGRLRISDRGVGMTVDTVRDYFLRAGASYRWTPAWHADHAEDGHSRVVRSGRFGIGVLSAYLLGNRLRVRTRHISAKPDSGIEFECGLEDDLIELRHCSRPIGTEIVIELSPSVVQELSPQSYWSVAPAPYHWWGLEKPSLRCEISLNEREQSVRQRYRLPRPNSELPAGWRRIEHPDYSDIVWSYSNKAPGLSCNGIRIEEAGSDGVDENRSPLWPAGAPYRGLLRCPRVSVFDSAGRLPLNLQRTRLVDVSPPFDKELWQDVALDIIAFLLVRAPSAWPVAQPPAGPLCSLDHPAWRHGHGMVWFAPDGVTLPLAELVEVRNPTTPVAHVIRSWKPVTARDIPDTVRCHHGSGRPHVTFTRGDEREVARILVQSVGAVAKWFPKGARALVPAGKETEIVKVPDIEVEGRYGDWILLKTGQCPDGAIDETQLATITPSADGIVDFWYSCDVEGNEEASFLSRTWMNVVRQAVIPYDLDVRRAQLSHVYEALADHIGRHEDELRRELELATK